MNYIFSGKNCKKLFLLPCIFRKIYYDEINNNFRSRYRADTIRTHVIRSYSSAVSSHESSSGSGGSSSSGGHSSGGGHGGGGGGSW